MQTEALASLVRRSRLVSPPLSCQEFDSLLSALVRKLSTLRWWSLAMLLAESPDNRTDREMALMTVSLVSSEHWGEYHGFWSRMWVCRVPLSLDWTSMAADRPLNSSPTILSWERVESLPHPGT
jgi:hypothetical protein